MMKRMIFLALVGMATVASGADNKRVWTDPVKAKAEDPGFAVQGEYGRKAAGTQVVALGDGQFYISAYNGGLPGAGWDGSDPVTSTGDEAVVRAATEGMKMMERTSPTLGRVAPDGAVVLVDGKANDLVKGEVRDGVLWAGAQTTGEYGSFSLHVEFRLPYKPGVAPSSQDRGNSGLYLHNRYEVQVLDSFGLIYDREKIGLPAKSDPKQWCACLYRFKTADVPMCLPPLQWQTYDIEFTAAK
ncbi:MAG: DUF1080 domain-containing protein, partial [Verrucomicrobiales bacterium]|nr:DUF1080 domain-containing protein [Verrucomicrobiales bacterium]